VRHDIGDRRLDPRWARSVAARRCIAANRGGVDVIAGSAGAIPALLVAHASLGDEELRRTALHHGEHLLHTARREASGWSWDTLPGATRADLTGFAHGAAGIAWALLELHAATGDTRYRDAALRAIAYEQHHFSPSDGNWPDLRDHSKMGDTSGRPVFGLAWCHGAPGIGLCRLRAWELLGADALREQAETAARTTAAALQQIAARQPADFTYCHGIAGQAELLRTADRALAAAALRSSIEDVFTRAALYFDQGGMPWPCGVPGAGETPGLMVGIAGIGHFYLRLHDSSIPSVLMIGPSSEGRPVVTRSVSTNQA
jgi:lantibiotic modifying enzyme